MAKHFQEEFERKKENIEAKIGEVSTDFVTGLFKEGIISENQAKNLKMVPYNTNTRLSYLMSILSVQYDKADKLCTFLNSVNKKEASEVLHGIVHKVTHNVEQHCNGKIFYRFTMKI